MTLDETFSTTVGDVEVDVCGVVDSGETIVTEIVLFQPEVKILKSGISYFSLKTLQWTVF